MEGMCTRFQPHMVEIARLVKAGALGEIVAVMADLGHRFVPDPLTLFSPPSWAAASCSIAVSTRSHSPPWSWAHRTR